MSIPTTSFVAHGFAPLAGALDDIPIMYEDEEEGEMGESNPHRTTGEILHAGVRAHLVQQHPQLQAFANMNLYYRHGPTHPRTGSRPYISPDIMIVAPLQALPEEQVSYTIGREGPAPLATIEALSERTAEQRDLDEKIVICARLGVAEYILVDPSGAYLPQRLLLKRLQPDGIYRDEQDADGGITSKLGFRIVIESDGKVRVMDALTGWRYLRPDEADMAARRRFAAEEQAHIADQVRRAAEEARRAAEEARRVAEEGQRAEAEKRRLAEDELRALREQLREGV